MSIIKNRVVWVTGASAGIGEALVYQLAAAGAVLVISARRVEALERVRAYAEKRYQARVMVLPLDLEQPDTFAEKTAAIVERFGGIDILVHNGGITQRALAADTDLAVDRRLMEVNYFGAVALTKAVLPHMLAVRRGHIVATSSLMGKIGAPRRSAYAAAKHALHGFFDSLRLEHWRVPIYVTLVCPGYVRTEVSVNALDAAGQPHGQMDENQLRGVSATDCAKAMVKAIRWNQPEIYYGKYEVAAVYLKRFLPGIFIEAMKRWPKA